MKKISMLLICMLTYFSYAQNVGIGTRDPKNKLHVAGGVRIDSLSNKKDSGVIFHNSMGDVYSVKLTGNKNDLLRGDGTFAATAALTDAWLLGGNAGTDSMTNFLGTTDNAPLRFRVRNEFFGSFSERNISIGMDASYQEMVARTGLDNIAIGSSALQQNLRNGNTAVGHRSMVNLTGDLNTVLGNNAMSGSRTGSGDIGFVDNNVALGASSLLLLHSGNGNTAVGNEALKGSIGDAGGGVGMQSTNNTAIGYQSMKGYNGLREGGGFEDGDNTAVGAFSLYSNTWGHQNTALGYQTLYLSESPQFLTAVGYRALYSNSSGEENTAVGHSSLTANTSGSGLTALGYRTLSANTTGLNNTALGNFSLTANTTGRDNTATGNGSLFTNTTGNYNTSSGRQSMFASTTGSYNTASGFKAMYTNTTGTNNTASGFKALNFNTTGSQNAAFGYEALNANTIGNNNTAIGYRADVTSPNLTNATAIGYQAKVNASNKVRIGNAAVTVIEGQVPFTTPSDGKFKYNVKEDVHGLDFILKLRPVTYQFDVKRFDHLDQATYASFNNDAYEKAALIKRTGFIAQEVEHAAQETNYDFSGVVKPETGREYYSLSYESFVVPLVKAIQEQQQVINRQQQQIDVLIRKIEQLENKN